MNISSGFSQLSTLPPVAPIDHVYGTLGFVKATTTQRYAEVSKLRKEIEGKGAFTLFAPSNDAWDELDPVSKPVFKTLERNAFTIMSAQTQLYFDETNTVIFKGSTICTREQCEHWTLQRSALPHGKPPCPHQRHEEWHDCQFHVQWRGTALQPLPKWGQFMKGVDKRNAAWLLQLYL